MRKEPSPHSTLSQNASTASSVLCKLQQSRSDARQLNSGRVRCGKRESATVFADGKLRRIRRDGGDKGSKLDLSFTKIARKPKPEAPNVHVKTTRPNSLPPCNCCDLFDTDGHFDCTRATFSLVPTDSASFLHGSKSTQPALPDSRSPTAFPRRTRARRTIAGEKELRLRVVRQQPDAGLGATLWLFSQFYPVDRAVGLARNAAVKNTRLKQLFQSSPAAIRGNVGWL